MVTNPLHNSAEDGGYSKLLLRVNTGPLAGRELSFTEYQTMIIGRSSKAQVRLSGDQLVSRFHCRVEFRPPDCVVVDLCSRNGTLVNGIPIECKTLLDGDQIQVGESSFTVCDTQKAGKLPIEMTPTIIQTFPVADESEDHVQVVPEIPGYRIGAILGRGGMGTVYRAHQLKTDQLYAIKVLNPALAAASQKIQRFVREASVIMRLQHKRIVEVFEFGLTNNVPFLVMEHINCVPFSEMLSSAPPRVRLKMAAGVMARVLEGLHFAHTQDFVHRDIKPSNILIFHTGRKLSAKLADFGVAKNFVNAGLSGFTRSDEFCGTISYMAPEQIIDCRYAKPACDIYSAGVCLYNMISGRLPYEEGNISRQISMILNNKVTPLSEYVKDLPKGFSELIEKAMNHDSIKRFETAENMLTDLLPFAKRGTG